jgi:hypothetical protein
MSRTIVARAPSVLHPKVPTGKHQFRDSVTESKNAVFLSYAAEDADEAQRLCAALRAARIQVSDPPRRGSDEAWQGGRGGEGAHRGEAHPPAARDRGDPAMGRSSVRRTRRITRALKKVKSVFSSRLTLKDALALVRRKHFVCETLIHTACKPFHPPADRMCGTAVQ